MTKTELNNLPIEKREDFLKLKKFLTSKRLYSAFVRNFKNKDLKHYMTHKGTDLYLYIWSVQAIHFIVLAFDWAESDQGHNFWGTVDDEWRKHLRGWDE